VQVRQKIKKIPESETKVFGRVRDRGDKRYGWLIFWIIFFWGTVGVLIFGFEPEVVADIPIGGSYLLVSSCLFMALFLSLSLLFLSTRSGLWWSGGIIMFLYFRLWGLGSMVNGLLILGVLLSIEIYFRQVKSKGLQK